MVVDVAGLSFQEFVGRFPETEYQNLLIDAHHYQCFANNIVEQAIDNNDLPSDFY